MALSLSDRIGSKGRIAPDGGSGFRANPYDDVSFSDGDRGGTGDDEGSNKGQPHSSSGFKRALMHSERSGSQLSDQIVSKTHFGGKGFKKPNYFAQGGRRHGMHIGSGAPAIQPAQDGIDSGGE